MNPDSAAFHDLHDLQAHGCRADPEARLAELARAAGPLRRAVAAVAGRMVATGGWRRLGHARAGDYAREQLGRSPRSLQDWARVDRRLACLPRLERALVDATLAWSKVRLLARCATPEDEAAWIAYARGHSVRALARAVRAANRGSLEAGAGAATTAEDDEAPAWVRVPVSFAVAMKWHRLRKVAPQVAGERLAPGAALEMVTAEVLSALPLDAVAREEGSEHEVEVQCASGARSGAEVTLPSAAPTVAGAPGLPAGPCVLPRFLRSLVAGLDAADAFELDARLRRAVRLEQRLEAELGPLLRQVSAPDYEWKAGAYEWKAGTYEWKAGTASLGAFARDRLGLSARKLRALVQVERAGDCCPALRAAYRDGRLSWLQAQWLARVVARDDDGAWRERWVAFAQEVSVRRLEDAVQAALALQEAEPEVWERRRASPERLGDAGAGERQVCAAAGSREGRESAVEGAWQVCAPAGAGEGARDVEECRLAIRAPAGVACLFRATLCSVRLAIERETGRLPTPGQAFEAMLDHAVRSWQIDDPWLGRRKPAAVRVFERDGWRCTVPGCSSRRHLQAHHIRFRSRGGGDAPANLTTLCAFHHQRGVHAGVVVVRGEAPDRLVFELGCRPGLPPLARYRSGDRRCAPCS